MRLEQPENTSRRKLAGTFCLLYSSEMTNPFQEAFHTAFSAPRDLLVAFVEQKMGAQVMGLERVTQGYVNEVYYADLASSERVIVRIRRRGVTSFASEGWALGAARRAGVPVPEVYALETLGAEGGLEVMLLSLVPGRPLGELWPGLNEEKRRLVMGHVGRVLRGLQLETGGWGRRSDDGSWEFSSWQERAEAEVQGREADVLTLREAGLSEGETDGLMTAVRAMLTVNVPTPVLCHGDLGMDHLFVDESLNLTGVIDFGMWRAGPCELDFAVLSMYHPDVSLAWLEAGYGTGPFDKDFYRRVLSEQIAVGMGFLAHDLRLGNADYLDFALLGLRGSLRAWRAR